MKNDLESFHINKFYIAMHSLARRVASNSLQLPNNNNFILLARNVLHIYLRLNRFHMHVYIKRNWHSFWFRRQSNMNEKKNYYFETTNDFNERNDWNLKCTNSILFWLNKKISGLFWSLMLSYIDCIWRDYKR